MRIQSLRARLTVFYVSALAVALLAVGGLIYALLAQALYSRIDDNLHALLQITSNSLRNDLEEGQDVADAARSTAAELSSREQMLAIYDPAGRLRLRTGPPVGVRQRRRVRCVVGLGVHGVRGGL